MRGTVTANLLASTVDLQLNGGVRRLGSEALRQLGWGADNLTVGA